MVPPAHTDFGRVPDEPDAAVIRAAAAWRARLDRGLTGRDETELATWLAADVRHGEVLAEMDATWTLLDRTRELPVEATAPAAGPSDLGAGDSVRRRRTGWGIAAAAAVLVAGAVGLRLIQMRTEYAVVAAADAGAVKRLNLPDGSTVRLNSDGAVRVEFTGRERSIRLERGEASFSVARDPARPFVVRTHGVQVRAIGTVFTVSNRAQSVEVLVSEGRVGVDDADLGRSLLVPAPAASVAARAPVLAAGEKVVIAVGPQLPPRPAAPVAVAAGEMAAALAWQDRRLEFFTSTPLAVIAAEFNRFNHHRLVVADPALAAQRFAGSFRADDPETFVQLIETRVGVRVERKGGETILRLAR